MPSTIMHYIHRVGRTARAGKSGRSVTLVGEKERKLLKEVVKKAKHPVKSRVIPQEIVMKYRDRIAKMEKEIKEIEQQEVAEKEIRISELKMNRAKNMLESKEENRPKRTWFQTPQERQQEKAAQRLGDFSGVTNVMHLSKEKRKEILAKKPKSADERVELELKKAAGLQIRMVKKQMKPKRIRACVEDDFEAGPKKKKQKKSKAKSSFDEELTSTSQKALKRFRSGPSYGERKQTGMVKKGKAGLKGKNRYKRK